VLKIDVLVADDELSCVALAGRIDVKGLHEVDARFHAATVGRGKPSVVDLSKVDFIASLGMGMLISCGQSLQRKGTDMVLLSPQGMVEETLRTAGVDAVMAIVGSMDEARRRLGLDTPGT